MYFIILMSLLVAAMWAALAAKYWMKSDFKIPFSFLGLVVVISGSVFGYDLFHIPAPIPITSDRAMLGALAGLFGLMVLRKRQSFLPVTSIDLIALALLATIVGSAAIHDYSYSNNLPISRFLFFYLMPFVLFVIVRNATPTPWETKAVLIGLAAFACYLSLTAIFEVKGIYALVFPKYILSPDVSEFLGRGRGPFLNPISNGIFLTTGLAAAVVLFWHANDRMKLIIGPAIPLLAIGNVATLTRSVWLGMAAGVGIVIWIITNRKQRAVLIMGTTLAGLLLLAVKGDSLVNFKRDKHVSANEMSKSAQLRPIFAAIAWDMFQDRPIFGCGFGQYNREKLAYLQAPNSNLPLAMAKPYLQHNVFLSLLTEVGLIGCGLLIMLLGNGLLLAIQLVWYSKPPPESRMIALALIALLCAYGINGMFHDTSIIPMANMLLFLLLGIVTRLHQQAGLAFQFDRQLIANVPAIGNRQASA